jgi:hypothetical protein
MRTSTALVALFVLASVSQLSAQDGRTNPDGSSTSSSTSRPLGAGEKIPPHQQPKAGDVQPSGGNGNYIDQLSAEDKALDRKLKGICRGC